MSFHVLWSCLGLAVSLAWALGASKETEPSPPVAKVVPKIRTIHGESSEDNYFWLRDIKNPDVLRYLEAENAYTAAKMKSTETLQGKLYSEMLGRIQETDAEVPNQLDDYFYYSRTEKGKQYSIFCRKKGTVQAAEEVLVDPNRLAEGQTYFHIGVLKTSPNHKLLAYSTDATGSETFDLVIKDLKTGRLLHDQIPKTYYSVEWANDNKTLFYTTLDAAKRPYRVYRHALGQDIKNDHLVFEEKDDTYELELLKTKDKEYVLISSNSRTTSEVGFLKADQPAGDVQVIHPRQHEVEYYVEHWGSDFYIRTNDHAKNFKLMKAPVTSPGRANWQEVIPGRDSVALESFTLFQNHLVTFERENGLQRIRVRNLKNDQVDDLEFTEPTYALEPGSNLDFHTNVLRFTYESLVTPRSVFDYDMDRKTRQLRKRYAVLGGYDPARYRSERIAAKAADGTLVNISLVYKKGLVRDGSNPLLLHGYGSYGSIMEDDFSSNRFSLLDRGFIYAVAHIRGGSEMGRNWYERGRLLEKKNTFTDFIACAEHLIAEKYTSSDKLAIYGVSAGGLLMGAVTTMRPDLFHAVVAKVPFVDVINTMLDPSIPLTTNEYEEWGNPNEKDYYGYMKSYAPYENVHARSYPNILVTGSLNDPRVPYWEPAKWVAKLRANKTDHNLLLLKTNTGPAGHGGSSGRYDHLKETAFEFAFILKALGMEL